MFKTYSQLIRLRTFEERVNFLDCRDVITDVGDKYWRYISQNFYHSKEWYEIRNQIILRDSFENNCCDCAFAGAPIDGKIYVHHIEPLTSADFKSRTSKLLDPENLVCLSYDTHQLVHYGIVIPRAPCVLERSPNDTCPWM